jgi:hypothetical protein
MLMMLDSMADSYPFAIKITPFQVSTIRKWFDDRITSWLHLVPLDARLHDLHSTLA